MAVTGAGRARHTLQPADPNHGGQRQKPESRLDVLYWVTRAGFEGQPLVVNNTMYMVSPYPNTVFALDLTKKGGPVKWIYKPHDRPGVTGRGMLRRRQPRRLVRRRQDGLQPPRRPHGGTSTRATGKMAWDTQLDSIEEGATMTMAPLIVGSVVLVGNSGAELGVHGWIAGLDLATGQSALARVQHRSRFRR